MMKERYTHSQIAKFNEQAYEAAEKITAAIKNMNNEPETNREVFLRNTLNNVFTECWKMIDEFCVHETLPQREKRITEGLKLLGQKEAANRIIEYIKEASQQLKEIK